MPTLISEASLQQQKVLAIVPKVTSLLSLLGSLYIVYDVLRMPYPMRKLYHRLMLGMSVCDCLASSAYFLTTWPIPPEVFPIYGAAGTQQTCTAQGYFSQLAISTVLYLGCLACYYFLVIRWGWVDRRLSKSKVEYLLHALPCLFGVVSSSIAAGMGLINPIGWDCWIAGVPLGCQESWLNGGETTCKRGDNANLYQWIFFYLPLWITILVVTVLMIRIICYFREQERKNARWSQFVPHLESLEPTAQRQQQTSFFSSSAAALSSFGTSSAEALSSFRDRLLELGGSSTRSLNTGLGTDLQAQSQHLRTKSSKRARDVMDQCFCYVGSLVFVWIFPTILRIHELTVDTVYYHWVLLSAMMVPSQGVFNYLVYVRPRYKKVRAERKKRQRLAAALLTQEQELELLELEQLFEAEDSNSSLGTTTNLPETVPETDGLALSMEELQRSVEEKSSDSDGTLDDMNRLALDMAQYSEKLGSLPSADSSRRSVEYGRMSASSRRSVEYGRMSASLPTKRGTRRCISHDTPGSESRKKRGMRRVVSHDTTESEQQRLVEENEDVVDSNFLGEGNSGDSYFPILHNRRNTVEAGRINGPPEVNGMGGSPHHRRLVPVLPSSAQADGLNGSSHHRRRGPGPLTRSLGPGSSPNHLRPVPGLPAPAGSSASMRVSALSARRPTMARISSFAQTSSQRMSIFGYTAFKGVRGFFEDFAVAMQEGDGGLAASFDLAEFLRDSDEISEGEQEQQQHSASMAEDVEDGSVVEVEI